MTNNPPLEAMLMPSRRSRGGMRVFVFRAIFLPVALGLLLGGFPRPCSAQDEGCTVTGTAGTPSPAPACVGQTVTVRLSATRDDPKIHKECAITDKSCSWSESGIIIKRRTSTDGQWEDVTADYQDDVSLAAGDDCAADLTATLPVGYWEISNIKVTASWTIAEGDECNGCDCGECETAEDTVSVSFTVVGVDKIIVEGSMPPDDGPAYVCVGESITLKALSTPEGASFPEGHPHWSLESKPAGSSAALSADGDTAEITPDVAGEYVVKAECGTSSDTFTVVGFTLTIKYPHGNPSLSATNWTDKSSDEANSGNERTFTGGNTARVSTVTVPCEAKIKPPTATDLVEDRIRWTIGNVGQLQATWSDHVTGDPSTGKGAMTTATFTTPATGLPAGNSAFGPTTVTMTFIGSSSCGGGTSEVEIFYPRNARNHPGGNQTPPNWNSNRSPNWFYYWNKTGAGDPNALFNSNTQDGNAEVPAMKHWAPNMTYDKEEIWIDSPAASVFTRRDGSGQAVTGIDTFANFIKHENVHVEQIEDADALLGNLNGMQGTVWEKGWSWFTPGMDNHATPGPDGQPGRAGVDDDTDGIVDEFDEFFALGSDDVDLDNDTDDVPNDWEPGGGVFFIEDQAKQEETVPQHTYWLDDWGDPGKQHQTNKDYND